MWKLPFGLSRPNNLGSKGENSRRRPRSCPRLERLEERIALSAFQVNTTLDTVAVNLSTGRDAAGHVSLRSAIMAANAQGGSNTINLPGGTYKLTIAGANEDADRTGDLDITSNLTISGAGASGTVIDGNNLDRVIHVLRGATTISGVTIENGLASLGLGGGLYNGGQVTLSSVVVTGNRAIGRSAGAGANGSNVFGGNGGDGGDGSSNGTGELAAGGGIYNAGSLSISNSTISANKAIGGDGGKGGSGGSGFGLDRTVGNGQSIHGGNGRIGGDGGPALGGGIYNLGASLTLSGTRITSNVAQGGQGGEGGSGGSGTGGAGADVTNLQARNSGDGTGGEGMNGGAGGLAKGGGLFNQGSALLQGQTNTFDLNMAVGGAGGDGGAGGYGKGSRGSNAVAYNNAGTGGIGQGGNGGFGGAGGLGYGGGLFNTSGGSIVSTAAVNFSANHANGGAGGNGGVTVGGSGGAGGNASDIGGLGRGGMGGFGRAGSAGAGSRGGAGIGGGLFNDVGGTVTFQAPVRTRALQPAYSAAIRPKEAPGATVAILPRNSG